MADTFGEMIKRVLRATRQSPSKMQLSDLDDTQYIADRLNEAFTFIYSLKPTQIDMQASLTLTPNTLRYAVPVALDPYRIYKWSWRIQTAEGSMPLGFITKEALEATHPDFETFTADKPELVYFDQGKICFYPLLNNTAVPPVVLFEYPGMFTRYTSWSQSFPFADNSDELLFAEFYARSEYGYFKSLGTPETDEAKAITFKGKMIVKYARLKRQGHKGYRRFR